MKSDDTLMPLALTRTLRLKVRSEASAWLNRAATETNAVLNHCHPAGYKTVARTDLEREWLSGSDRCALTAGASQ